MRSVANPSFSLIAKQIALHDGVNQIAKPAAVGGDIRNNPIHIAAVGGSGLFGGADDRQTGPLVRFRAVRNDSGCRPASRFPFSSQYTVPFWVDIISIADVG